MDQVKVEKIPKINAMATCRGSTVVFEKDDMKKQK